MSQEPDKGEAASAIPFANLDPETIFKKLQKRWIEPELERRNRLGLQPGTVEQLRKAFVIFGREGPPRITLNDEVEFVATAIPKRGVTEGQSVGFADVADFIWAEPPRIDGRPASYVIMFFGTWDRIAFNFRPSFAEVSDEEWDAEGFAIVSFVWTATVEETIGRLEDVQRLLEPYGWWIMHPAIPQPLAEAIDAARRDESKEAVDKLFVEAFGPLQLQTMVNEWMMVPEFEARKAVILEALQALEEGKTTLPIPALLPLVEGIISDWLAAQGLDVPRSIHAKTREFAGIARGLRLGLLSDGALDSLLQVWNSLGLFANFEWTVDDHLVLNRHKVSHGKFVEYWTPANNLRAVLFLDSIYRQIRYRASAKEFLSRKKTP
jgi:hypothetical protein